jgi:YVTN family beta-propeller protein
VVATFALPSCCNTLQGVAVSSLGTYAYVAYFTLKYVFPHPDFADTLGVINTATNTVVGGVSLGQQPVNPIYTPQAVAVAPDGTNVYVTDYLSDRVSINAANSGANTILVGARPVSVAFTPDGAYAYVANNGSNNVSVIATSTNSVVATVPVGANPRGVGIIP